MNIKLLVDGSNLMHRVYWVSEKFNRPIVPMFLSSIRKLNNEWSPDRIYIAWDTRLIKDSKNYRKEAAEEYKGTRDRERNKKVYSQEKPIRDLCKALGVCNIFPGQLEADDVIYHLSRSLSGLKVIVSSDFDMLQLISSSVHVHSPMKKVTYDERNFTDHFPVPVSSYVSYKALIGDKSDNIQGIPGVGPRRAVKILSSGIYESLSPTQIQVYEHNMKLVDLHEGLNHHPEEKSIYDYQLKELDNHKSDFKIFTELCNEYGVEDNDSYSTFFSNQINNAVLDILS
jgi:DNA polymerase I